MKLSILLLCLFATASAITVPASTSALRPSASAFRPHHKAPMNLRGGGDFPIDVNTALKIHAGVYALYGAICFPDLNLPLLDLGLKMHGSRASYFYNDMTPESESNVKMNRWVGSAFATVGAATYLVATEGSGQIQKSFAKMYAVVWAINWAIALVCRMPWTGGGPIISPVMSLLMLKVGFY